MFLRYHVPMQKELIASLQKGNLAVIPTDTLYGLIGLALSKRAVSSIYTLKGRNEKKPLIILISNISELELFDVSVDAAAKKVLKEVWPGKVTVILPVKGKKFEYLHRGTNSLAFRLPDVAKLRALIKKTGPLVAPSANPEGLPPAESIEEARKYLGEKVMYVDGGKIKGKASTIVRLTENGFEILRQGSVKIPKKFQNKK